jgi:hypothetical protein
VSLGDGNPRKGKTLKSLPIAHFLGILAQSRKSFLLCLSLSSCRCLWDAPLLAVFAGDFPQSLQAESMQPGFIGALAEPACELLDVGLLYVKYPKQFWIVGVNGLP